MPRARTGTRSVVPATTVGLLAALAIACSGGSSPPASIVGCANATCSDAATGQVDATSEAEAGMVANADATADGTADAGEIAADASEAGTQPTDAAYLLTDAGTDPACEAKLEAGGGIVIWMGLYRDNCPLVNDPPLPPPPPPGVCTTVNNGIEWCGSEYGGGSRTNQATWCNFLGDGHAVLPSCVSGFTGVPLCVLDDGGPPCDSVNQIIQQFPGCVYSAASCQPTFAAPPPQIGLVCCAL
jgi:hypothetical protein